MQACPKCGYVRKPTDTAPEWQCPSCLIVYAKFGTSPHGHAHNLESATPVATAEHPGASVQGSLQGIGATETHVGQRDATDEQAMSYASKLSEDKIVRQFQRSRWWTNMAVWPLVALGFILFFLGIKPHIPNLPLALVGFLFIGVGAVLLPLLMRCPNCHLNPMAQMRQGTRGVLLNPARCPNCGVRLK